MTWLELHALFRLHGGKVEDEGDEHNPKITDATCTKSLQCFKTAARWLTTFCVSPEEEWKMQTSYSRHNRLIGLGISKKHAAVRGMLVLDKTKAEAIATQIMQDKGNLQKKKDREFWQAQNLFVFQRPFHYKGKLQKVQEDLAKSPSGRPASTYGSEHAK